VIAVAKTGVGLFWNFPNNLFAGSGNNLIAVPYGEWPLLASFGKRNGNSRFGNFRNEGQRIFAFWNSLMAQI
jgi:hypothetical protein